MPLEVLKNIELASTLPFFLGGEFLELGVFGEIKLEKSCKTWSEAVTSTPLEDGGSATDLLSHLLEHLHQNSYGLPYPLNRKYNSSNKSPPI